MSESKKTTPLPTLARGIDEVRAERDALMQQLQQRHQQLGQADPLWRDLRGRIEALSWLLPDEEASPPQ